MSESLETVVNVGKMSQQFAFILIQVECLEFGKTILQATNYQKTPLLCLLDVGRQLVQLASS